MPTIRLHYTIYYMNIPREHEESESLVVLELCHAKMYCHHLTIGLLKMQFQMRCNFCLRLERKMYSKYIS